VNVSLGAKATDDGVDDQEVQVLEFGLDNQRYCVGIDKIAELVDREDMTTFPDTADHVAGVMNLRGETTTIIDPKVVFELDDSNEDGRVIIYEGEQRLGWLVDQVYQVSTVSLTDLEKQEDTAAVRGLVNRDGDFLIWVNLDAVNTIER
jgi:purine-binding chemotaxis protein CheW